MRSSRTSSPPSRRRVPAAHLARHKTQEPHADTLFVRQHKSVIERPAVTDINFLTPPEAINLLNEIKAENIELIKN